MDGENVNVVGPHELIDDPIGWVNDLAHRRIFELRDRATRFGELRQSVAAIRRETTTAA